MGMSRRPTVLVTTGMTRPPPGPPGALLSGEDVAAPAPLMRSRPNQMAAPPRITTPPAINHALRRIGGDGATRGPAACPAPASLLAPGCVSRADSCRLLLQRVRPAEASGRGGRDGNHSCLCGLPWLQGGVFAVVSSVSCC